MLVHPIKRLSFLLLGFLCFVSSGLSGCGGYDIEEPEDGSVHVQAPPSYVVNYLQEPEELPEITLNGLDVSGHFSKGPNTAVAVGEPLAPLLVEGQNRLKVLVPFGPLSTFIYDTRGPEVIVLENKPSLLYGFLIDEVGVESLYINQMPVPVRKDDAYFADIDDSDIYTFEAMDTLGHVSVTQFKDYRLPNDGIVKAHVNQAGLDLVAAEARAAINAISVNSLLANREIFNEVKEKDGPFGTTLRFGPKGTIKTASMSLGSLSIDAVPSRLELDGEVDNIVFSVALVMFRAPLYPIRIQPTVRARNAEISGNVLLGAQDGRLGVTIDDFSVDLKGVRFDGALGVFDALSFRLLSGLVMVFDERISEAFEDPINDAVEDALDDLVIPSYQFTIADRTLRVDTALSEVFVVDGGLNVGVSGGIQAVTPNPLIPQPLGPIYTGDAVPYFASVPGNFGVTLNTNFINQALVAAYYSGLAHITIMNGDVIFNFPRNDFLGANGDTRVLIDPVAAPYVQVSVDDDVGSSTPSVELRAQRVQFRFQRKNNDAWESVFSTQVSVRARMDVTVAGDNTLDIVLPTPPVFSLRETVIGEGFDLDEDAVEAVITRFIPDVMESYSEPLTGIRIPELGGGYTLYVDNVLPLGANASHLGVSGSLTRTP